MVKAYAVGGFVRDELLGIRSKDIDVVVEVSSFEVLREYVEGLGAKIFQERPQFGVIRATHPTLGAVDYVMCRRDGVYSDARRPDSIFVGSLFEDLSRRDFTVNAIAKDPDSGQYIDPFNGREDLENRVLRCVGKPLDRFTEDPLRVFRALRFAVTKRFTIDPETESAIASIGVELLSTVPDERVQAELTKMFEFDTVEAIEALQCFPELFTFAFSRRLRLIPSMKPVKARKKKKK